MLGATVRSGEEARRLADNLAAEAVVASILAHELLEVFGPLERVQARHLVACHGCEARV